MDLRLARLLHRGVVPGITVSERLLRRVERESRAPDGGKEAALSRAARLIAVCRGLGFRGVHICGAPLDPVAARELLHMAGEFYPRWREFLPEFSEHPEEAFFLYREDPETGLNVPQRVPPGPPRSGGILYRFSRLVHRIFFSPRGRLFPVWKKLAERVAGSSLEKHFTRMEYWFKKALFDCQECGDCVLAEMAFLCPQSQCAKYLLNGPCGGSQEGWCEVYPGKRRCVYVRIYERLRPEERRSKLLSGELSPRDWALFRTSSWLNFYLGRSNSPPEE